MQSRWFDFGGDTIIKSDQHIRLTSERASQQGWLWSRVPLTATNWETHPSGWQIEVEFKIHGHGHLYGDGMAMWLTKQRATPGPVFGSTDKFEGLGIFFDTYKNNRPGVHFPYVMAMLGDGKTEYDQNNDGKANDLGGCSAQNIRGVEHPTKARLTYFQDSHLRLDLQYKEPAEWTKCFELQKISIPTVAYLGFSAHTGELSDNHDIIRVETKNIYNVNPSSPKPGGDRASDAAGAKKESKNMKGKPFDPNQAQSHEGGGGGGGGGWSGFFFKVLLFVVVAGGAYVGFTIWRSRGSRF
ncbi:MAG: hypothetical protein M1816_004348 [Peltula sp. TS41687]|nr:MAG: hypothetical protein M1816_004348 [Peltula sp. TS41687]